MYIDGAAMCGDETQSIGCSDLSLEQTQTETETETEMEMDKNSRAHQVSARGMNQRVSCENCIGQAGIAGMTRMDNHHDPSDPQLKDNSWHRYKQESPQAPTCNTNSMPKPNETQSELPQSAYAWPANRDPIYPNITPDSSNHTNAYGNPLLVQQQRPAMLVIVVNKPMDDPNNPNMVFPIANYQATASYPPENYPREFQNGAYNFTASGYPIHRYQAGYVHVNNSGNNSKRNVQFNDGHSHNTSYGAKSNESKPTNRQHHSTGIDTRQDHRQKFNCCTCTTDDENDGIFTTLNESGEENDCECTCNIGELEKTLRGLIPNENCLCFLRNRKKRKKRKPRSVFDRFASPPFVIEPKPNPHAIPSCCMCCCRNRSCFYPCHNNCCNSCHPWC